MEKLDDTYSYSRTCERCSKSKPRIEFSKSTPGNDVRKGYGRRCKECRDNHNYSQRSTINEHMNNQLLRGWAK